MINGELVVTTEKTYDWPELTKDRIFDMVDLRIRAGTTGAPDGIEDKESWLKVLPMITNLSIQMQNLQARGMDYEHIRNLLHETLLRYDDRIDSNLFIPNVEKQTEGWSRDDDPNLGMNWFSERRQKTNAEMNYGINLLKEETGNDASSK
ncbi:hypothetical protein [Polynucleobacter asymbioticus]|uniref:hypothetical protein n=1 Tax=Polynucleobacter asymbioticus TaxID=576611 RepID=UPI000AB4088C|nr:hypothetical protein [Polynucleobacter asymbioticus]